MSSRYIANICTMKVNMTYGLKTLGVIKIGHELIYKGQPNLLQNRLPKVTFFYL